MSLKRMCYKAGGYARRNDPYRREYYSSGSPRPGATQPPASGQDVSPIGGCGVAIFMFGGLLALACPPLGVIVFLIGGLIASGSAIASNHREQTRSSVPPPPIVPAAVQPDDQNRGQLLTIKLPPRPGKSVEPEPVPSIFNRVFDQSPPALVQAVEPGYSKCACGLCGQHLEFPTDGAGMTIICPACQQHIILPRVDPANEI